MDCLIRKVQQGDEFDLAYIQTESWKAAFKDMLWVFTNNIRARKFYESFGFFTHGKVKPCLETEEICYERKL